ncbi:MAG: hypothetical protein ACXVH3_34985 [Solirubrobacteraceae bacterium]
MRRLAAVRESVLDELKDGSLPALQALGDVTKIPSGAMRGITARLVDWLAAQREKAAKGATDFGGSDLAQALAVILSFHPDDDAFASLLGYLNDRAVARSLKRGALRTFISNSEHFSAAWRGEIPAAIAGIEAPAGAGIEAPAGPTETPIDNQDISAEVTFLTIMLGNPGSHDAASHMARLLAGDERQRVWACRLAASEQHENLKAALAILISDQAAAVRASAGAALVSISETGRGDPLTDHSLANATNDPGILVPAAIASEAAEWPERDPTVRDLLKRLQDHASATVRLQVSRAIGARQR